MSTCLDAALAYAARGWYVFPCAPLKKTPLTTHGFKDATTDPAQITRWWTDTPGANIGIDCGRSGLVVVDLDVKNGVDGRVAWAILCQLHEQPSPETMIVDTPSSGRHLYFTGHAKSCVGIRPGIDIRGDGSYVLAPPSTLPNGAYHASSPDSDLAD